METADQPMISNICLLSHMESLFRYAIVLSQDAASASDLVRETYVRALGSRNHFRDDSTVRGWLFTILRNIWLDQQRRTQRFLQEDAPSVLGPKMGADQMLEAIRRLPGESREIIALREFEDLSYHDIARLLRCSTRAVMSRLAKARARLRMLITDLQSRSGREL